ncbi:MAG: FCD domain-containing protein [Deltaproteobacteria bacterium]
MKEFSAKEIRDFFEARMIIECHIVSQLVGSLNESDFTVLDETVASMQRQAEQRDSFALLEIDRDSQFGLVRQHNKLLLEWIIEQIRFLISTLGHKVLASSGRSIQVVEEHAHIAAALKAEDRQGAVEAMKHYLNIPSGKFWKISGTDAGDKGRSPFFGGNASHVSVPDTK